MVTLVPQNIDDCEFPPIRSDVGQLPSAWVYHWSRQSTWRTWRVCWCHRWGGDAWLTWETNSYPNFSPVKTLECLLISNPKSIYLHVIWRTLFSQIFFLSKNPWVPLTLIFDIPPKWGGQGSRLSTKSICRLLWLAAPWKQRNKDLAEVAGAVYAPKSVCHPWILPKTCKKQSHWVIHYKGRVG